MIDTRYLARAPTSVASLHGHVAKAIGEENERRATGGGGGETVLLDRRRAATDKVDALTTLVAVSHEMGACPLMCLTWYVQWSASYCHSLPLALRPFCHVPYADVGRRPQWDGGLNPQG